MVIILCIWPEHKLKKLASYKIRQTKQKMTPVFDKNNSYQIINKVILTKDVSYIKYREIMLHV